MKQLNHFKYSFFVSTLFLISILSANCDRTRKNNIAGTYYGSAIIEEQVSIDGMVIFDTTFTTTDQLIVREVNAFNKHYHFELISGFKTYYNQSPLNPTDYILEENYVLWEGLDEYGYTYDDKKHWIFDPIQDTVYFRLARFPYGPTIIDNPDSIGHYFEELHTWSYVLRAER